MKDLKAVLHKDISKRLIENSAFQILDSWFSKQDKVNEVSQLFPTATDDFLSVIVTALLFRF